MQRRTFIASLAGTTAATGVVGTAAAQQSKGGGKNHTIGMYTEGSSYYFDPIGLYVEPGDTVTWINKTGSHSTTSYSPGNPGASVRRIPKGAKSWNSGVFQQSGGKFSYTFDVKGTYDYYCIPHKTLGMVGRIVCGEPGGPATKKPIPNKPGGGVMPESKKIVKKKVIEYPFVPGTSHGPPPLLFWGGLGLFSAASVYLYSVYDRAAGRYDENSPEDEHGIE